MLTQPIRAIHRNTLWGSISKKRTHRIKTPVFFRGRGKGLYIFIFGHGLVDLFGSLLPFRSLFFTSHNQSMLENVGKNASSMSTRVLKLPNLKIRAEKV